MQMGGFDYYVRPFDERAIEMGFAKRCRLNLLDLFMRSLRISELVFVRFLLEPTRNMNEVVRVIATITTGTERHRRFCCSSIACQRTNVAAADLKKARDSFSYGNFYRKPYASEEL